MEIPPGSSFDAGIDAAADRIGNSFKDIFHGVILSLYRRKRIPSGYQTDADYLE